MYRKLLCTIIVSQQCGEKCVQKQSEHFNQLSAEQMLATPGNVRAAAACRAAQA